MNKTKLIRTLVTLTPEEWSSFRKYLLVHTRKGSDNFDFFEYLHIRRDRLSTMVDADGIREKHFKQLTSKGFSNMMSRIFNWLEEWLSIEEWKKQAYQQEIMLVKAYNKRGLYKLANRNADKIEAAIKCENKLSLETNKALANLFHIQYYSENPIKQDQGGNILSKLNFHYTTSIQEYLSTYILEYMSYSRVKIFDLSDQIALTNTLKEILPESVLSSKMNQLQNIVDTENLDDLITLFDDLKSSKFDDTDVAHTLITFYLISISLKLWMKGQLKSSKTIGDIYEYAIDSKALFQNGKIDQIKFLNIVATLSNIKTYDWVKKFIEKYYVFVNSEIPLISKNLFLAQLCFTQHRYEDIHGYLISQNFKEFGLELRRNCLLCVALYKDPKKDLSLLNSKILNIKRQLKRKKSKVSQKFYFSHLNFIDCIDRLSKVKYNEDQIDISQYENILFRSWLQAEIIENK